MSYYKCKSIVKKNDSLTCTIASSNWTPITYSKCEMNGKNIEQKMFNLFTDLMSGNIHLDTLNDNTARYEYALLKTHDYLRENNIDSYNDLYCKQYDLYNKTMSEKLGFDITMDFWNNEEHKSKYNDFKEHNKDFIEELNFKSEYTTYKGVYEVFKGYLEEEEPKGEYYLYSNNYGYIKPKGKYGAFYYTQSNYNLDKGNYKKMYCKRALLDYKEKNIEIKRYVMNNTEIKKQLEKQEQEEKRKQLAKEKIVDIEQVKKDIENYKSNGIDLDKYYIENIFKICNIKCKIPKNIVEVSNISYRYKGKHNKKTSYNVDIIREKLKNIDIEVLGV